MGSNVPPPSLLPPPRTATGRKAFSVLGISDVRQDPFRPTSLVSEASVAKRAPPADRGVAAWLFLLSAFLIEGIMWGKFGIFLFPF